MKRLICGILAVVLVLGLGACALPWDSVVGTWTAETTILGVTTETKYVFNEDGTGTKGTLLDVNFTYTVDNGKLTLTMVTLGIESTEEYFYERSGETLTLTGKDGSITLNKAE